MKKILLLLSFFTFMTVGLQAQSQKVKDAFQKIDQHLISVSNGSYSTMSDGDKKAYKSSRRAANDTIYLGLVRDAMALIKEKRNRKIKDSNN